MPNPVFWEKQGNEFNILAAEILPRVLRVTVIFIATFTAVSELE